MYRRYFIAFFLGAICLAVYQQGIEFFKNRRGSEFDMTTTSTLYALDNGEPRLIFRVDPDGVLTFGKDIGPKEVVDSILLQWNESIDEHCKQKGK